MSRIRESDIKNYTYYFLDDTIIIKMFDPNNIIKIGDKSCKNILIYYIGYETKTTLMDILKKVMEINV